MTYFLKSKILFDDSSLSKILSDPKLVLRDVKSFWESEESYRMVKSWHSSSGTPFSYDKFILSLKELENPEIGKEKIEYLTEFINKIVTHPTFKEKSLLHVSSYLPDLTPAIEIKINLIGYVEPVAFARLGNIVLNITNEYWSNKDLGFLFNILVHEIYHFGFHYSFNIEPINPRESSEKFIEYICWWLQNEGIATYVSYSAQNLFPFQNKVPDYLMIDNTIDRERLSQIVNYIFSKCKEEPYEKVENLIWSKGVRERAFYVIGGYMSKKIDQELGRDELIKTIGKPFRDFVNVYNELNNKEFKIHI
ncbi:hypothetical protein JW865_02180 [Candidatus Bathyarchaeota archaeon]|nr:hypothetical protein [Candidatus Bathyarchaeota archaeon]